MHPRWTLLILLCGSALVGASCRSHDAATARPAIAHAQRQLAAAFARGDAPGAAATFAENAEWLAPLGPPQRGRAAIAEAWQAAMRQGGHRLRLELGEVVEVGAVAYADGHYAIDGPDGNVLEAGQYSALWARDDHGDWHARRHMFTWDIPPRGGGAQ